MKTETPSETPSRKEVWRMFDRIAGRYDVLNRLLSGRRDVAWRKKMVKMLPQEPNGEGLELLDVATGTGDQLFHMLEAGAPISKGIGVDLSEGMMALGRKKLETTPWKEKITFLTGDGQALPFEDRQFDAATNSFGIRNLEDVDLGLREMLRVLKPGGRALILECSMPENRLWRRLYLLYFRNILPVLGGLVSGDTKAYRYLNKTVETFPCGEAFCALMKGAGFVDVKAVQLMGGIATIYQGDRA